MDVDVERLAAAPPSRLAAAVSHVLHPVGVVVALLLLIGWRAAGAAGLAWALLAWGLCAALPFGIILWLVRRGRLLDAQVVRRAERGLPIGIGLTTIAVGIGVLTRLGAPRAVVALVVAQLAGLAAVGLATLVTKASMHTAVVAAAAAVLWLELGVVGLVVGVLGVGAVGWARVRGGRHTLPQVLLGAVLGVASSLLVYGPLR